MYFDCISFSCYCIIAVEIFYLSYKVYRKFGGIKRRVREFGFLFWKGNKKVIN